MQRIHIVWLGGIDTVLCSRGRISSRHRCRRGRGLALWLILAATEQALQKAGPGFVPRFAEGRQCKALQAAQLAQQRRQVAGLGNATIEFFCELFQWPRDIAGQRQALQLADQRGQRIADLVHAGFPALFGIQHRFLKARNQPGEAGVHVVAADNLAHFLHARVHHLVTAFGSQGAAHQTATQQVETGVPTALELFLLLDAFKVFFFPALSVFSHARVRKR